MYIHLIVLHLYKQPTSKTKLNKICIIWPRENIIVEKFTSFKLAGMAVRLYKKLCNNCLAWLIASVSSHNTAANRTSGLNNLFKRIVLEIQTKYLIKFRRTWLHPCQHYSSLMCPLVWWESVLPPRSASKSIPNISKCDAIFPSDVDRWSLDPSFALWVNMWASSL